MEGRNSSHHTSKANQTGTQRQQEEEEEEEFSWKGKRVLVTGATSGIGKALSYWFLNQGCRVALVGRDQETLESIGQLFPDLAIAVCCDLSQDKGQYDMCRSIIEYFLGLDIVINAAGVVFDGDILDTYPQDYDYIMDVNLRAPFHITQMCEPFLRKTNGCIINISCQYGTRPQAGAITYCISKAGLEHLTKCAALEFAPGGVRVNAVSACITDTNMFRTYLETIGDQYEDFVRRAKENQPLGKIPPPDDIAKAVIFLCSPQSTNITGQVLKVDGGRNLTTAGYRHWTGSKDAFFPFESTEPSLLKKFTKWMDRKIERKAEEHEKAKSRAEWIEYEFHTSKWATNLTDAHLKAVHAYQKLEDHQDFLGIYEAQDETSIKQIRQEYQHSPYRSPRVWQGEEGEERPSNARGTGQTPNLLAP